MIGFCVLGFRVSRCQSVEAATDEGEQMKARTSQNFNSKARESKNYKCENVMGKVVRTDESTETKLVRKLWDDWEHGRKSQ